MRSRERARTRAMRGGHSTACGRETRLGRRRGRKGPLVFSTAPGARRAAGGDRERSDRVQVRARPRGPRDRQRRARAPCARRRVLGQDRVPHGRGRAVDRSDRGRLNARLPYVPRPACSRLTPASRVRLPHLALPVRHRPWGTPLLREAPRRQPSRPRHTRPGLHRQRPYMPWRPSRARRF